MVGHPSELNDFIVTSSFFRRGDEITNFPVERSSITVVFQPSDNIGQAAQSEPNLDLTSSSSSTALTSLHLISPLLPQAK
jgi:hypothetical protein